MANNIQCIIIALIKGLKLKKNAHESWIAIPTDNKQINLSTNLFTKLLFTTIDGGNYK